MYKTLIAVEDLAAQTVPARSGSQASCQDRSDWLVIDCRFDLSDPTAGERAYAAEHIPLAIYAHLDRDLASPVTAQSGRHPLPEPEHFAMTLGRWGLTSNTQVIAYDADNGAHAARLWWLLRWAGHEAVAVLDGGFRAWTATGNPATQEIPQRPVTNVHIRINPELAVATRDVAELVQHPDWRLLDARAPERFSGSVEPIDRIGGHVPGARNHPFATNLSNGRFLPPAELRRCFERSKAGVSNEQTIAMCGSGVTACHLLLAMEHAGMPGARLYPGSWSEWIRDPTRPIATG